MTIVSGINHVAVVTADVGRFGSRCLRMIRMTSPGKRTLLRVAAVVAFFLCGLPAHAEDKVTALADEYHLPPKTYYRAKEIQGHRIFYREAGDTSKRTIVLLHGFPSSSHTYRELIPLLSRHAHVIAPDYLGSGYSAHPDPEKSVYTFDRLADHVQGLLNALDINHYVLYMQDFGAPVGFRLMQRKPEGISAIIVQNANAYLDGLTEARQAFFRKANQDRSDANVTALYGFVGPEGVMLRQYLRDVPESKRDIVNPDSWTFDLNFLETDADRRIQVQLFQDYQNNIIQYPDWQATMKKHQFPALIVWGRHDQAFTVAGAEAYLRDLPKAELHLLDAGHFAVEERASEIALLMLRFLRRQGLLAGDP
jgi:pimeloyl-ACP methyl ester carboxylesterase